jgi:hypothetical protein
MNEQPVTTASQQRGLFERHFQTGLQVVITALVIWAGGSLIDLRDKMILFEERDVTRTRTLDKHQADLNKMGLDIQDIKQDVHDLKRSEK